MIFIEVMIGMKIMDNCVAQQVGRERPPEGSHLGKFTQYSSSSSTQAPSLLLPKLLLLNIAQY